MSNQVFETVRTLLAIREYQDREVPEDVLLRVVEAGRLTASAQNKQPWHFVLVRRRESLRELGTLVRTGPYIANAAAAIEVAHEQANRLGVSDARRASQALMLADCDDGDGSNSAGD